LKTIKAFTWGYYGWGSASKEFVRAVDSLERKRGFRPPVFIDIRISRSVRAANFRNGEFEKIVGCRRYVWERRLGNKRIITKKGKRIQIAMPSAAGDLLDRIITLDAQRRHVIMFCSCFQPLRGARIACHRVSVGELLLKEAAKRRIALDVSEWPGESPTSHETRTTPGQENALLQRATYVPIGPVEGRLPAFVSLGWGSNIIFRSPDFYWNVITGPAYVRKGQWWLERRDQEMSTSKAKTRALSRDFCRNAGYGSRAIR
jgi:hypothetical protein